MRHVQAACLAQLNGQPQAEFRNLSQQILKYQKMLVTIYKITRQVECHVC